MAEWIKLAKMAGAMHEADHTYCIQSTWSLPPLANNVPFVVCVINSASIFTHYLDFSLSLRVRIVLF